MKVTVELMRHACETLDVEVDEGEAVIIKAADDFLEGKSLGCSEYHSSLIAKAKAILDKKVPPEYFVASWDIKDESKQVALR